MNPAFDTPAEGLRSLDVEARRAEFGPNALVEKKRDGPWRIFWRQWMSVMVLILLVAGALSLMVGDATDAAVIFAIVILNTLLGFLQEYRAEQALAALKKMTVPLVRVKRDGHVQTISSVELVPGDLVLLEAGNFVPADGRLLEAALLRVQEAALTGESEPVDKNTDSLADANVPLGDQRNRVFMGTVAVYGRGLFQVTGTGPRTELGKIAALLQSAPSDLTPLQKRLDKLGKHLALASLLIVAVVFLLGLLRGEEIRLMLMTAISLAVAAVPEGLPAVVTIALALGAQRMLKRRALIRKLPAVETLGSVTVICTDKTGTLTENRMTITVLDVAGGRLDVSQESRSAAPLTPAMRILLTGGTLCNDAVLEVENDKPRVIGDPTEGAFLLTAWAEGLVKTDLDQKFPRVKEIPFESDRKRMTTVHRVGPTPKELDPSAPWRGAHYVAFTKGAVGNLLDISTRVWATDHVEPITPEWKSRIETANDTLAGQGMRVLGVAVQPLAALPTVSAELEQDLVFVGLVGMIDPPRPEVKEAVRICREAGIRPIMITGDHPLTALHIAQQLGVTNNDRCLTGLELDRLTSESLQSRVRDVSVFARVSPEHKLRIVTALQNQGHNVAMTGDGVNDAPALKRADIGMAMGITGTDVAKEAADMVLLDDNFATIVAAVEEGRVIYDNIRKFMRYLLSTNSAEILVMLLAPLLGMPLPLLPLQILWINLVTDGLPALALGLEPGEHNIMRRPPVNPEENLFARGLGWHVLWVGLVMSCLTVGVGYYFWKAHHPHWQTLLFTSLAYMQMAQVLAIRSETESVFRHGFLNNKWLLGAVLSTVVLQLAVVYAPFLQNIFGTAALEGYELLISFGLGALIFFIVELEKWVRGGKHGPAVPRRSSPSPAGPRGPRNGG